MKTRYMNRVVGLRSVAYVTDEKPQEVYLKRGQSIELESSDVIRVDDGIVTTPITTTAKTTKKVSGGDE